MKTRLTAAVFAALLLQGCASLKLYEDGQPGTNAPEVVMNVTYWTLMILTAKTAVGMLEDSIERDRRD